MEAGVKARSGRREVPTAGCRAGRAEPLFTSGSSGSEGEDGSSDEGSSGIQFPAGLLSHYYVRDAACEEGYELDLCITDHERVPIRVLPTPSPASSIRGSVTPSSVATPRDLDRDFPPAFTSAFTPIFTSGTDGQRPRGRSSGSATPALSSRPPPPPGYTSNSCYLLGCPRHSPHHTDTPDHRTHPRRRTTSPHASSPLRTSIPAPSHGHSHTRGAATSPCDKHPHPHQHRHHRSTHDPGLGLELGLGGGLSLGPDLGPDLGPGLDGASLLSCSPYGSLGGDSAARTPYSADRQSPSPFPHRKNAHLLTPDHHQQPQLRELQHQQEGQGLDVSAGRHPCSQEPRLQVAEEWGGDERGSEGHPAAAPVEGREGGEGGAQVGGEEAAAAGGIECQGGLTDDDSDGPALELDAAPAAAAVEAAGAESPASVYTSAMASDTLLWSASDPRGEVHDNVDVIPTPLHSQTPAAPGEVGPWCPSPAPAPSSASHSIHINQLFESPPPAAAGGAVLWTAEPTTCPATALTTGAADACVSSSPAPGLPSCPFAADAASGADLIAAGSGPTGPHIGDGACSQIWQQPQQPSSERLVDLVGSALSDPQLADQEQPQQPRDELLTASGSVLLDNPLFRTSSCGTDSRGPSGGGTASPASPACHRAVDLVDLKAATPARRLGLPADGSRGWTCSGSNSIAEGLGGTGGDFEACEGELEGEGEVFCLPMPSPASLRLMGSPDRRQASSGPSSGATASSPCHPYSPGAGDLRVLDLTCLQQQQQGAAVEPQQLPSCGLVAEAAATCGDMEGPATTVAYIVVAQLPATTAPASADGWGIGMSPQPQQQHAGCCDAPSTSDCSVEAPFAQLVTVPDPRKGGLELQVADEEGDLACVASHEVAPAWESVWQLALQQGVDAHLVEADGVGVAEAVYLRVCEGGGGGDEDAAAEAALRLGPGLEERERQRQRGRHQEGEAAREQEERERKRRRVLAAWRDVVGWEECDAALAVWSATGEEGGLAGLAAMMARILEASAEAMGARAAETMRASAGEDARLEELALERHLRDVGGLEAAAAAGAATRGTSPDCGCTAGAANGLGAVQDGDDRGSTPARDVTGLFGPATLPAAADEIQQPGLNHPSSSRRQRGVCEATTAARCAAATAVHAAAGEEAALERLGAGALADRLERQLELMSRAASEGLEAAAAAAEVKAAAIAAATVAAATVAEERQALSTPSTSSATTAAAVAAPVVAPVAAPVVAPVAAPVAAPVVAPVAAARVRLYAEVAAAAAATAATAAEGSSPRSVKGVGRGPAKRNINSKAKVVAAALTAAAMQPEAAMAAGTTLAPESCAVGVSQADLAAGSQQLLSEVCATSNSGTDETPTAAQVASRELPPRQGAHGVGGGAELAAGGAPPPPGAGCAPAGAKRGEGPAKGPAPLQHPGRGAGQRPRVLPERAAAQEGFQPPAQADAVTERCLCSLVEGTGAALARGPSSAEEQLQRAAPAIIGGSVARDAADASEVVAAGGHGWLAFGSGLLASVALVGAAALHLAAHHHHPLRAVVQSHPGSSSLQHNASCPAPWLLPRVPATGVFAPPVVAPLPGEATVQDPDRDEGAEELVCGEGLEGPSLAAAALLSHPQYAGSEVPGWMAWEPDSVRDELEGRLAEGVEGLLVGLLQGPEPQQQAGVDIRADGVPAGEEAEDPEPASQPHTGAVVELREAVEREAQAAATEAAATEAVVEEAAATEAAAAEAVVEEAAAAEAAAEETAAEEAAAEEAAAEEAAAEEATAAVAAEEEAATAVAAAAVAASSTQPYAGNLGLPEDPADGAARAAASGGVWHDASTGSMLRWAGLYLSAAVTAAVSALLWAGRGSSGGGSSEAGGECKSVWDVGPIPSTRRATRPAGSRGADSVGEAAYDAYGNRAVHAYQMAGGGFGGDGSAVAHPHPYDHYGEPTHEYEYGGYDEERETQPADYYWLRPNMMVPRTSPQEQRHHQQHSRPYGAGPSGSSPNSPYGAHGGGESYGRDDGHGGLHFYWLRNRTVWSYDEQGLSPEARRLFNDSLR